MRFSPPSVIVVFFLSLALSQPLYSLNLVVSSTLLSPSRQALVVYLKDRHPLSWAKTHDTLARAYVSRGEGDRARNVEDAIEHWRLALEVYRL